MNLGTIYLPNENCFSGLFLRSSKITKLDLGTLYEKIKEFQEVEKMHGIIVFGSSVRPKKHIFDWMRPNDIDVLVVCSVNDRYKAPDVRNSFYPNIVVQQGLHLILRDVKYLFEKDSYEISMNLPPIFETAAKEGVVIVSDEVMKEKIDKLKNCQLVVEKRHLTLEEEQNGMLYGFIK